MRRVEGVNTVATYRRVVFKSIYVARGYEEEVPLSQEHPLRQVVPPLLLPRVCHPQLNRVILAAAKQMTRDTIVGKEGYGKSGTYGK